MGCCNAKPKPPPGHKRPVKPPELPVPAVERSFHENVAKPIPVEPSGLQPMLIPENTERLKHFYDVQQPPSRVKLYDIAKEVQILSLEKASPRDWHIAISRSLNLASATGALHSSAASSGNCTVRSLWDQRLLVETAGRVLSLPPRDWVQEQLVLYKEQFRPGSDMATTARRKTLQLQEHFKWFAWAAAAYFLVTVSGAEAEKEFAALFAQQEGSFASHPNSSTATNVQGFDLPTAQETWLHGFAFKGVYVRLAVDSTKEAAVLKAEAVAMERLGQAFQAAQESLAFALLFPMTALVSFGPYLLHATPVIPGNFIGKSIVPTLEVPCPPRAPLVLPKENLLQLFKPASDSASGRSAASSTPLSTKPLYFVVNVHSLLLPRSSPRFLLFLSSLGSEIRVMKLLDKDPPVPSRAAAMVKSEGKELNVTALHSKTVERFGWVFDLHSDVTSSLQRPNRVASLLIPGVLGDFLVTVRMKSVCGKHLTDHKSGKDAHRQAVKSVVSVLETTDTITNHAAFGELLRRHRLRRYISWLILSKLKDDRARVLVQTELLARAVKRCVHSLYAEKGLRNFTQYRELAVAVLTEVMSVARRPREEVMLCLFLSRLRALRQAGKPARPQAPSPAEPKVTHFQKLLEHEFLREVYSAGSRAPGLFLSVRAM